MPPIAPDDNPEPVLEAGCVLLAVGEAMPVKDGLTVVTGIITDDGTPCEPAALERATLDE
jgi:hypothetical protein